MHEFLICVAVSLPALVVTHFVASLYGRKQGFVAACEIHEIVARRREHRREARVKQLEGAVANGLALLEGKGALLPVDRYAALLDLALQEIRRAYAEADEKGGGT